MPPTIFGDGTQTRDFIHVTDVVGANMHVFENDLFGLYHVGTGIETSVNKLWDIITGCTKTDIIPHYLPAIGEIQRSALGSRKLQQTGWKIMYDIDKLKVW
jgi:UDP-glucose 4-epimerase